MSLRGYNLALSQVDVPTNRLEIFNFVSRFHQGLIVVVALLQSPVIHLVSPLETSYRLIDLIKVKARCYLVAVLEAPRVYVVRSSCLSDVEVEPLRIVKRYLVLFAILHEVGKQPLRYDDCLVIRRVGLLVQLLLYSVLELWVEEAILEGLGRVLSRRHAYRRLQALYEMVASLGVEGLREKLGSLRFYEPHEVSLKLLFPKERDLLIGLAL